MKNAFARIFPNLHSGRTNHHLNLGGFMKNLMILGQPIEIKYTDAMLRKDELGLFDSSSMSIHIQPNLKKFKFLHDSVLLHEIIHTVIHISGNANLLGDGVEESLTMALEYGLRPFLKLK